MVIPYLDMDGYSGIRKIYRNIWKCLTDCLTEFPGILLRTQRMLSGPPDPQGKTPVSRIQVSIYLISSSLITSRVQVRHGENETMPKTFPSRKGSTGPFIQIRQRSRLTLHPDGCVSRIFLMNCRSQTSRTPGDFRAISPYLTSHTAACSPSGNDRPLLIPSVTSFPLLSSAQGT